MNDDEKRAAAQSSKPSSEAVAQSPTSDLKEKDPFAHLSDKEKDILKRQVDVEDVQITYLSLFRYATINDMIIMAISTIAAIGAGATLPLMTIIFGGLAGLFQDRLLGIIDLDHFDSELGRYALFFVYLAIGEFLMTYTSTLGFSYTGEHISVKIREKYLASMMRQNIGYFDQIGAGEITTRMTSDSNLIQDGISEKIGLTLAAISTFVTAFVIGFAKFWKLTLILCATVVVLVASMGVGSFFIMRYNKLSIDSYSKSGTVVEEVFSSIRNVVAFGTHEKLARRYDLYLKEGEKYGRKMKIALGLVLAAMMTILFLNYGLAFWMGSRFLVSREVSLGDIITILLAIIIGAFSFGHLGPWIQAFASATAVAGKIYAAINRESPIDPTSTSGRKLETVEGNIELRDIKHIYPSRPEVVVMDGVSLIIPAGKTTALVGASGSGKSTIVGLVERFYDPVRGEVLLDGCNVRDLNLNWLRQHVALVQQEPVLFATSIFQNIRHGLIGTKYENMSEDEVREMVVNAAIESNAHNFISALPEGYDTNVGERGFLISGGQKQRIAIARAIISDPKILLLDEATSALDTKSEGVVQAALDKAAKGRTTIIIAHRLSTVKDSNNIVVMSRGRIVEQGTHNDLVERQGIYYNLVEAQGITSTTEDMDMDAVDTDVIDEKLQPLSTDQRINSDVDIEAADEGALELEKTQTKQSLSSLAFHKKKEAEMKKYSLWALIKFIASFNKKDWFLMSVGLFWSIIAGGAVPTQSIFFAKSVTALSQPESEYDGIVDEVSFWSLMYLMLAMTQLISFSGQGIAFAICSERLLHLARLSSFRSMLRQDVSFFDKEENSSGALTSFLSTETAHVQGLSGTTLGTIFSVLTTLIASCTIALAIGWKLALVCIAVIPVVIACGFIRLYMIMRFQDRIKRAYERSASYACEVISAIRTAASLTRERDVLSQYHVQLVHQQKSSFKSVVRSSALFSTSQSVMFLCSALGFWYGGRLLGRGEYTMFQFFVCFTAILFGAQSAGTLFSFAPDVGKAKHAAAELKKLSERKPEMDPWSSEGEMIETLEGNIDIRDVHFRYPNRRDHPVLRGINLNVKSGQYVALVGASGCGKSTAIALLERFYDPLVGGIFVDGKDISRLNVRSYRSHLAIVSQEPTLYQGTIKENILLGVESDDMSDEKIEKACRDANIYDFILSLPDGFATICGSKGALLSGGQKQRIAIARALLRDPKILLLDEATSALDSESEKVVQMALDDAAKGRTTVAVAHRLSSIQTADVIFVFDNGRIVESGTHNELLERKGKYFELVILQSLKG